MKISYDWLKDYVDPKVPPDKLSDLLTMAGITTESVRHNAGDSILDIEVTSNRPDWLSYIGIAREISAITGSKLRRPSAAAGAAARSAKNGKPDNLSVRVEDKALCPLYTARIIKDIKVGASPEKLKKRLDAMGLKTVNNVVDVTNFCLFETGEPMHAFDLDRISGKEIIVRKALKGEKIKTIDGVERELTDSMLVIADRSGPIAIAGVMGGLNTEVTVATKNILIEAAVFDPVSIRRTARALGMSTESSYRFERRVDPEAVVYSSSRAASLISELAGGKESGMFVIGKAVEKRKEIVFRMERIGKVLGAQIPAQAAGKMLSALGLTIKESAGKSFKITAPSFRSDLNDEIDIIEEVARIYGYNKIPATLPAVVDQPEKLPFSYIVNEKIRSALTGLGLSEIITYSLLSKDIASISGQPASGPVEIRNPLSAEQEVMRPTLAAGIFTSVLWNINRKAKDLGLFEIGSIYVKKGSGFKEEAALAIAITGEALSWAEGSRKKTFFDLKGAVETVFAELGVKNAAFKKSQSGLYAPSCSAAIEADGESLGACGEVAKKILGGFDIKETVYFCEISLEALMRHIDLKKRFKQLPKYPAAQRDISIVVSKDVLNSELLPVIRDSAGALLTGAALIDRYTGAQIPDGMASLTYRLEYMDPAKTLEEKDVSSAQSAVLRALEERFKARLRQQ